MHGLDPLVAHDLHAILGRLDPVCVGRLILTLILAGIVGLERSTHERASGLRTHILVGLGSCLITMAGAYGFTDIRSPGPSHDPYVLATYVVSGIGFLGAGAILRHGTTIRGLTTAASVWNVAGIGIAAGAGMGLLAAVTVALILFVLVPLQRWESRLRIGAPTSDLTIHLHHEGKAVGRTLALISSMGLGVRRATVFPGAGTSVLLRVDLAVSPPMSEMPALVKQLLDSPDVARVETAGLSHNTDTKSDPDGKDSARRLFVRSRSEPARDLSRRKVNTPTPASPVPAVENVSAETVQQVVLPDELISTGELSDRPPLPTSPDEGDSMGSSAVKPRRPRPRV